MANELTTFLLSASYVSTGMTDLPIELARHYREEADRVRRLAADAVLPGVRDALLSVVRQYDDLAESVSNSGDYPGRTR